MSGDEPSGVRTAWRVAASVAAVVVVGTAAMSAATAVAHSTRTERAMVDATPIRVVEVTTDSGDVAVTGVAVPEGGARRIDLRARLVDGLVDSTWTQRVVGDRLVVELRCNPFWIGVNRCDLRLDAHVPDDVAVRVTGDNGDVTVRDVAGGTTVHTDNGDVRAERLASTVEVGTDNGDIEATDLTASSVTGRTSNGDEVLDFATPPTAVDASSDNGSIEVVLPRTGDAYALTTSTDNGDVNTPVSTDPSSGRRIRLSSDNGDLTVRY